MAFFHSFLTRALQLMAVALWAGLSAGCTSPYLPPEVQSAERVPGILELFEPEIVERAATFGQVPLRGRLIVTHGMCSDAQRAADFVPPGRAAEQYLDRFGRNWAQQRAALYFSALGMGDRDAVLQPVGTTTRFYAGHGHVTLDRFVMNGPSGNFEIVILTWGRHVDSARSRLAYDNYRAGEPDEQVIDAQLGANPVRARWMNIARRTGMNGCLVDPVVYLGSAGNPIRHTMRQALCSAIGGRPGDTVPGARGAAAVPGAPGTILECPPRSPQPDETPTVLLPESLGSTIMIDAFEALSGEARILARRNIRGIYLMSNQYPLLALANPSTRAPRDLRLAEESVAAPVVDLGSLASFLAAPPRTLGSRNVPQTWVIAITDPNDILGYRIPPSSLPDVRVGNVLVSNAPTLLGLVSHPLGAHTGWQESPQVFDLLVHGSPMRQTDSRL